MLTLTCKKVHVNMKVTMSTCKSFHVSRPASSGGADSAAAQAPGAAGGPGTRNLSPASLSHGHSGCHFVWLCDCGQCHGQRSFFL